MQMPTLRQGDQPSRDAWKYEQPGESPRRSRKRETWRMAERPEKASSATKPEKTWSGGIVSMNKQHRTLDYDKLNSRTNKQKPRKAELARQIPRQPAGCQSAETD
jgi:hypothetical protein